MHIICNKNSLWWIVPSRHFFEFLRLWLGECLIKSFAKEPLVQSSVMGTNI